MEYISSANTRRSRSVRDIIDCLDIVWAWNISMENIDLASI